MYVNSSVIDFFSQIIFVERLSSENMNVNCLRRMNKNKKKKTCRSPRKKKEKAKFTERKNKSSQIIRNIRRNE